MGKSSWQDPVFGEAILNAMVDTFFVFDPRTGKAVWWNNAFRTLSGYSDEEISQLKAPDAYYNVQDVTRASDAIARLLTGESLHITMPLQTKDGRSIPTEYTASLLPSADEDQPYIAATGRDVSEAKRSEEERTRFFDLSLDIFCSAAWDGYFKELNPAWTRILGYTIEEGLSRQVVEFVHPDDRERTAAEFTNLFEGHPTPDFTNRYFHKDGSIRFLSWATVVLPNEGLIYALGRDVTERVLAEREKANLENQLRQSQKMEAVGQLAGGVAHDFNNLLTVILGNAELGLLHARDLADLSGAIHALEEISRAGEHGARLTKQMLTFSRKQIPEPQVLDVNGIIIDMGPMLSRLIGEHLEFDKSLHAEHCHIQVDKAHMEQAIMNLVLNARDAMPGGGRISMTTANVVVDRDYADKHIDAHEGLYTMVRISDTGSGMTEETIAHVFEPFFTTKPVDKGTGLGLATVYGIVKQADGHITVESEPGQGSTFSMYFPTVDNVMEETETVQPADHVHDREQSGTVLLCEDEHMVRRLACHRLAHCGFSVIEAENGKQALELVAKHDSPIDILVTDVVMPQMNGKELAREMKKQFPDLPVLFMSGYTIDRSGDGLSVSDGVDLLQKPFDLKELCRRVHALLARHAEAK